MISGRLQSDEHGVGVNLDVGFHRESFPEQIKKISIHRGGGGLANFVVLANSKLTGFTAVSYFFTLTRDEPEKSQLRSWLKNKERTKVPEKFVNSADFPHLAAEVLLGSSAMGDTA